MEVMLEDPKRADDVLTEIDKLIDWKSRAEQKIEKGMMHLALYLLEAKQNAYWVRRGFKDETEWIKKSFPQSRSQYYYLIGIAEKLGHYPHEMLEDLGVAKCTALARVQKHFQNIPENYFLHAKAEDKDTFTRRVKSAISKDCSTETPDPKEEIHFRSYKFTGDQIFEIETAMRILRMELGTDKSDSYAIHMLCVEYLSGVRDDGLGRIQDRNAYIMQLIGRLYNQLDREQPGIYDRLISHFATWVEKGRDNGHHVQNEESEAP